VVEFHSSGLIATRWIGVDLNTTGHVAVAADPHSGKVMKLGKNTNYVRSHSSNNCTKLYKEGKLWKLKRFKSREKKIFKAALHAISRQIVSFAESLGSGIKLEKLFSARYTHREPAAALFEFSFENGSFFSLQRLVERRAHDRGIPVMYVNPAYTSKRCSRCGGFGRRTRKRFECPHCGFITHADVNAAFNIAVTSIKPAKIFDLSDEREAERCRITKKQVRRMSQKIPPCSTFPLPVIPVSTSGENLLAALE
jgi:putative transposase